MRSIESRVVPAVRSTGHALQFCTSARLMYPMYSAAWCTSVATWAQVSIAGVARRAVRSRMSSVYTTDVWRVQLCRYGSDCKHQDNGLCPFAHTLHQLRPPHEVHRLHDDVSDGGVDRFYGQDLSTEQLARFKWYNAHTPWHQKPTWAWALWWFLIQEDLGFYPMLGEDFGMDAEVCIMLSLRAGGRRPFQWMAGFWERIDARTRYLRAQHLMIEGPGLKRQDPSYVPGHVPPLQRGASDMLVSAVPVKKQKVQEQADSSGIHQGMSTQPLVWQPQTPPYSLWPQTWTPTSSPPGNVDSDPYSLWSQTRTLTSSPPGNVDSDPYLIEDDV